MKKAIILLAVISMLTLTGCTTRISTFGREPDELELIRTIGIDKGENGCILTIGTGVRLDGSSPKLRQCEGPTIEAALNILKKTSKGQEPFYSHTEHVIIGEELAKEGLDDVLNFMMGNSKMRVGSNIFIAKGTTAQELMSATQSENYATTDILDVIKTNVSALGQGYVFTSLDVATETIQTDNALILAVELGKGDNPEDENEKKLYPSGFGIIKSGRLTDYVSPELAPGVTMLINKLKYMNVQVETDEGIVAIGITGAKTKYQPVFAFDKIEKMIISVDITADVTEESGVTDLMTEERHRELSKAVSDQILLNLRETLRQSQDMGIDYIGIGEKAELKAPLKFEAMNTSWEELYPELDIELSVNTVIRRTFDLGKSINVNGGQ